MIEVQTQQGTFIMSSNRGVYSHVPLFGPGYEARECTSGKMGIK